MTDEDLARSEARFRAMVEFAPEAIVIVDMSTMKFSDANAEAENLFGLTRTELLARGPLDLAAPVQPGGLNPAVGIQEAVQRVLAGESADMEWVAIGAGGRELVVEVHARLLPSSDPALVRASIFDITRRKRAEERLAKVQRLEALARLAGGVAHDFNNMLTVILGCTEAALSQLPGADPIREILEDVTSAAERAALITRQLLAFGRKSEASPRIVDLTAYVDGVQPVLRRLVGEDVSIVLVLERRLAGVLIDTAQLEQIVVNLVANARDAMPGGGRITIRTANVVVEPDDGRQNGVPPGRYVVLGLTDTGVGIPEAIRGHIFEPFFTTKDAHHGTGLGLATVHGIVGQCGGHVVVRSEAGRGTTFEVFCPAADGERPADVRTTDVPPARVGGSETILLVEDEGLVRAFLRSTLQNAGYAVLEASNAGEALLLCEQHESAVHLLLTDVIMPRMTGAQLAARLRTLRPELRVLYITGSGGDPAEAAEPAATREAVLAKPLGIEPLLRGVRAALDRPHGHAVG